ncbi:MAG: ornithine carbamoyltransferase [candidate division Zixibacteria bacterium]|nr:ornithine carbamoyltransferase [candidate division Zixibacteria bacterium]
MPPGVKSKDFLRITDFSSEEIRATLVWAGRWKAGETVPRPLEDQAVGLIFHKPSLRTRQSFEAAVVRLGGHPMFITDAEIQLGVRESIHDVAHVMSRYLALIVIRTFKQSDVEELARHAAVPVINALTDVDHPCQVMGDILTAQEHLGRIDDLAVAFLGDGNNVFHAWANLAARIPMDLRLATSPQTLPDMAIVENARRTGLSKITISHDPTQAVRGADIVYTDVWASMGQKDLAAERTRLLKPFQVNADLLKGAKPGAIVMHCLPAERGREITDGVIDGPQSVVFDEAENRLWVQGAIIAQLLARRVRT